MFDLVYPRHGAVLNRHHGVETARGLEIEVRCVGGVCGRVTVNGREALFDGLGYVSKVLLSRRLNTITAVLDDTYGRTTREITVVWDKASYPRYEFFIDDNCFFLTEIARQRPKSLFEHFYLKFLREMHSRYGTKFMLNLFYRNEHDEKKFTISEFPADYRAEWEENAHWLKLAFHAYAEFPDRPYQNASVEELHHDFELVKGEIMRFAGPQSYIAPVGVHWAMCRPELFAELRAQGIRVFEGQYINPHTGLDDNGSSDFVCDLGYFQNLDEARYLEQQRLLYKPQYDMFFCCNDVTVNLCNEEEIRRRIAKVSNLRDFISIGTHEQYTFPGYFNYLPDHQARIETAIREVTERGCKPVFVSEGMLGNRAWE